MGTRTKLVTDLQSNRMLDEENGLFIKELLRIYGQTLSLDPYPMMSTLLGDSMHFFNERVFEAMGVSAETSMEVLTLTEGGVLAYVQGIYPGTTSIVEYGGKDDNDVEVISNILKTPENINLPAGTGTPYTFGQTLTFGIDTGLYDVEYGWYQYDDNGTVHNCRVVQHPDNDGPYVTDVNGTLSVRLESDATLNPQFWSPMPDDFREVIAVSFVNGGTTQREYFFTESMVKESEEGTALMLMMRKDFQNSSDTPDYEADFLYARFGLNAADPDTGATLEDEIDDENVKDVFLSYACSYDDEDFQELIQKYYGNQGDSNEVVVDNTANGGVKLVYQFETSYDDNDNEIRKYTITYQDSNKQYDPFILDDEGNMYPYFIIPIAELRMMPMYLKFEAYNRMFSMFVFTEQEIEIKWYQTMFFRFIMLVISIYFVGFGAILAQLASEALSLIDPRLAAVLALAYSIYTGDFTQGFNNSFIGVANNTLSVVQTFHQAAFQSEYQKIQTKIEARDKETQEMREEIKEDFKTPLIISSSSDKINFGYNGLFELPYQQNELLAQSIQVDTSIYRYT